MSDTDLGNIFYSILAKDLTGAGTQSAKGNFIAAGLAIGAATTAIGGAAVAMIDQNNKLMGSIDAVSQETGIEADSLRDLTMALANGKDKISEVTATMNTLGKFSVTTSEQMQTATEAALALGNANSITGDTAANNVIPALQAYGLTVDDLGSKSDALTEITHSTKYSLTDVTNILARAAPVAAAAGLSFDDMTAVVEALGQKGVPARMAVNQINTALKDFQKTSDEAKTKSVELTITQDTLSQTITQNKEKLALLESQHPKTAEAAASHALQIKNLQQKIKDETTEFETNKVTLAGYKTTLSDTTSVNDRLSVALGISKEKMADADAMIKTATGSTDKYNTIAKEHVGLMANISSWWEKTTTNIGAALTPYSGAFTAITALGGAMTVLNGFLMLNNSLHITSAIVTAASTVATYAATAAQWLFNLALDANPIGIIILAVAGLVAAVVLLDQKFHFIQPTLEWFSNALGSIAGFLRDVAGYILNNPIVGGIINTAVAVGGAIGGAIKGHAIGGTMGTEEPGIVGEAGPELFVPSSSGNIIPNAQLGGMGGQSHEWNISIVINGANKNEKQIALEVVRQFRAARQSMGIPTSGG